MKKELAFEEPILVTQPKLPDFDNYLSKIKGIWDRKWLTNSGPLHETFKENLREYLNVNHCELFTNGHLALEIAIKALNLKGEIIVTPFTFISTIHAAINCGLTPVFCDIDKNSFNIDPNEIEKYITKNTCAILAVHVYGMPCDVKAINEIAEKHNLRVIYDAAHAFSVEIDEQSIGNFGDISMFSFHATKVFHSIEGGLLTYNDEKHDKKLRSLRNFGITSSESVDFVGTNAKMNEFQAAMGLANLESISNDIEKRKMIYTTYAANLRKTDIKYLQYPSNVKPNYAYFPILLRNGKQRDWIHEKLKAYNIFTRRYFYPLCSDFNCYESIHSITPVAYEISNRILCLPMYTELEINVVEQICEIIKIELGEYDE